MYRDEYTEKGTIDAGSPMGLSYASRLQPIDSANIKAGYYRTRCYNGILKAAYYTTKRLDPETWENSLESAREAEKFAGRISERSIRKIKNIVNTWNDNLYNYNLDMQRRGLRKRKRMVMITLTLSEDTDAHDNVVKRELLNTFLTMCRKQYPGFLYLWRAERQKNGRLHFHIITDKYIPKQFVTNTWNNIQETFFQQYWKDKEVRNLRWPSTKVEAVRDLTNGLMYLVKYVSKEDNGGYISGRTWSASRELTELKPIEIVARAQCIRGMQQIKGTHYIQSEENKYFMFIVIPKEFDRGRFMALYGDLMVNKPDKMLAIYKNALQEVKRNPYRGIG